MKCSKCGLWVIGTDAQKTGGIAINHDTGIGSYHCHQCYTKEDDVFSMLISYNVTLQQFQFAMSHDITPEKAVAFVESFAEAFQIHGIDEQVGEEQ